MRRFLSIILILLCIAAPAAAQFSFLGLKNSLVDFVLDQISVPGELEISAEGVEDAEDGATEIVGLAVADGEGVWLRVERLSLRWNASRVLRGELEINRLAATGVDVIRPPASSAVAVEVKEDAAIAQTDDDPFDWPRSPLDTKIESLELLRVFIAEGVVAPQSVAFDATGALTDEGDEQSLHLEVTRTDDTTGRILLDFLRNFASNELNVTLEADEASGGLVAALAGFPSESASRVNLKAQGPLTDWALTLDAAVDDVISAKGEAKLSAIGRIAANADFTITPGPLLPETYGPEVAAALSPEGRIKIDLAENDEGVVIIRTGEMDARDLSLIASGTYDRRKAVADLDLKLDVREGLSDLAEGVAFQGLGFDGSLKGPLNDLVADGRLFLNELRTAPADVEAADLAARVLVQNEKITVDVRGGAHGVRLDRLTPALLGSAEIVIDGVYDGASASLNTLRFASAPLTLEASGGADLAGETANLTYQLSAPRLGPLAAAYDQDAEGAFRAEGAVTGPFSLPALKGELAFEGLRYQGESYGTVKLTHEATFGETPEGVAALAATGSRFGEITFDGAFRLAGEELALKDLIATGLGARIEGAVNVDLATSLMAGDVTIDAPDLSPLEAITQQPASGAVEGRIALAPASGAQGVTVDLALSSVNVADMRIADAKLNGRIDDALGAAAMDIKADMTNAAFGPAKVASAAITAKGDLATLNVDARLNGVDGDASIGDAALAEAALKATLKDLTGALAASGELTARKISGFGLALDNLSVTGSGEALTTAPVFDATATLNGADLGGARIATTKITAKGGLDDITATLRADRIAAEGASVASAALDARVREAAGGDPAISAKVTLGAAELGVAALRETVLTAEGRLSALALNLNANGAMENDDPLTLAAAARANLAGAGPEATLSQFSLRAGEEEIALRAPLRIASAGGATTFKGLDLGLPGGGLTGEAALHGNGLSGNLLLDVQDLKPASDFGGLPLEQGALRVDARFDTRPGSARADVTAKGSGLRFSGGVADIGALELDAALGWNGSRANVTASASGPFKEPFRLSFAAPLRPSGSALPVVPQNGALEGAVDWKGRLGDLWALVPAPGHILDGDADVALRISGTMANPALGGNVSLRNGQYENLDVGTILVNLDVTSTISEDGAFLVNLAAEDGSKGKVSGRISLKDGEIDAQINADDATLVRRDDVTAALTIDLAAIGPVETPDVKGVININRAEVRLVAATPPGVADLGDIRFKGEPIKEEPEKTGGDIPLQIDITGEDNIYVRGRGLDSEWRIDLAVRGTAADPRITGVVEKRRGVLAFLGRQFDLERGTIRFTGSPGIDPTLDVQLLRENDGVKGGIAVSGTAGDPRIHFTSQPALPEEEVLPRVLFGRSKQSLSPTEALSLASGLATLMDGTGGFTDGVRGAIGLDVLRLDEGATGPSVTIGSNVVDGVFVGAKQPIDGGAASVIVELEVFENVTVDSEVGPETGTSLGVKWKKDF